MEKKYEIKKTLKNSLQDILDIRKKNIKTDYLQEPETSNEKKKTIKICYEELKSIENEPFSELTTYMNKIFVKFNYSPIIDKLFPSIKKESDAKIESIYHLWRYYSLELNRIIHKTKSDTFAKKILHNFVTFINKYLTHIFSIPKIAECLNLLNKKIKFKIYDFENDKESKDIYLNIENELKGTGCTFIFLKELRRLYDCLIYAQNCFKVSIMYIFFHGINNLAENLFYKYVIENEVVSSLLYQIKLIFEKYSDDKDVVNFINKYTIDIKKDLKQEEYDDKINDVYNNPEFSKRIYEGFDKEYDEIDKYNLDTIPKKVNYVYKEIKDLEKDYKLNGDEIEFQEDEKVKEINDLDELVKYIQGDNKKKKKKKKKKENPFNKLAQFNNINNINLPDDQMSIISHDTIFSNFKKDIRNDNYDDDDLIKIKPVISDEFIENLK